MKSASVPKISIIVPCYNVEGYLPACLESLAAQTHESFEVICIDDGSKDATGRMLDEQASADSRFRVIHQEHRGPSVARNVGICDSSSPLISFVDGDDYVSPRYLEVLEAVMEDGDADMACCSFRKVNPQNRIELAGGEHAREDARRSLKVLDMPDAMRAAALSKIGVAFWGKLMRREILGDGPFPVGKVYEDLWCFGDVARRTKRVATTELAMYGYVMSDDSITRRKPAPLRTFWHLRDATARFEESFVLATGVERATDDPAFCTQLVHRLCGQHAVLQNAGCSDQEREQIAEVLREELVAAWQLALLRGVSPLHPQMIRAKLLIHVPAAHDAMLSAYQRVAISLGR